MGAVRRAGVEVIVGLLLFCSASPARGASDLYVSRATEQHWSGGVAGRSGARYAIVVVSTHPVTDVEFDGLWIDDGYIALPGRVPSVTKGDRVEYEIRCGVDHTAALSPDKARDVPAAPTKPRPSVTTRAVLDVRVRGKARVVPIAHLTTLPPAAYP